MRSSYIYKVLWWPTVSFSDLHLIMDQEVTD